MAETEALARRVAGLESALAFQERRLETLDKVVREFAAEVERLRAALTRTEERLAASEQQSNAEAEDDPNW